MKKLWTSPEVFAAIITIAGTLLVSVILGFVEGRIGFGSIIALFAIFLVGALIFFLFRRGGARMAIGGGLAMVFIGFLVFFGYRLIRDRLPATGVETPPAIAVTTPVLNSAVPGDAGPAENPTVEAPPATPAPVATAAPTTAPPSTGGPIVGVWEPLPTLPQKIISFCACPEALYAGAEGVIYRSDDAGATWTAVSQDLPSADVIALACVPGAPSRVYAALETRNPFLRSDDGGVTWQVQSNPDFTFGGFWHQLLAAPSQPDTLYFLSEADWIMLSPNAGKTWIPASAGLPESEHGSTNILSLAIAPNDANTLYAGTGGFVGGGRGVYKSTDGGQSWTAANAGMLDLRITALAIDPLNPQTLYAGSSNGDILKSTDGGASWVELDPTPALPRYSEPREIRDIVLNPQDPRFVILVADNSGPLVSRNGGETWQMLGKPDGHDQPYFEVVLTVPEPEIVIVVDFENADPQRYFQTP